MINKNQNFFSRVISPALQAQVAISLASIPVLIVSYFYLLINDSRYPQEKPELFWGLLGASFLCFIFGHSTRKSNDQTPLNLKEATQIVFLTWIIACILSAGVYIAAGFPNPQTVGQYGLWRRLVDSFFESMSGFTTTGSTILMSVEVFPRSVLLWRAFTQALGGLGLCFVALGIWPRKSSIFRKVFQVESESPDLENFSKLPSTKHRIEILTVSGILALSLFILLTISGSLFRITPYERWYDNVYDSLSFSLSTVFSGGFAPYDASIGLYTLTENGTRIAGGLQNPISEWIVIIFMIFSGVNITLWYILFSKQWKKFFKNHELQLYIFLIVGISIYTALILIHQDIYPVQDGFRYAVFSSISILTTTGLVNTYYNNWPTVATSVLFSCYLLGAMAGSNSGGLTLKRYLVLIKYIWLELRNLIQGTSQKMITIGRSVYTSASASLVIINMYLFYLIFILGSIAILITNQGAFIATTANSIDLGTALGASIASLTNIGPAVEIGTMTPGSIGNYSNFSNVSKILLALLMLLGKMGILVTLLLFIQPQGENRLNKQYSEKSYDSDTEILSRL